MAGRQNLNSYLLYVNVPFTSVAATSAGRRMATLKLERAYAILGLRLSTAVTNVTTNVAAAFVVIGQDATFWSPPSPGMPLSHLYNAGETASQATVATYSSRDGIKVSAQQPVSLYLIGTSDATSNFLAALVIDTYFIEQ